MTQISHFAPSLLARTPVVTFVLIPVVVLAWELLRRGGTLGLEPWGVPLLAWGYAQYRFVGRFRTAHGGGGPGIDVPPTRIVIEGPYRFTRNPMYLAHLIFMLGLAITLRSYVALGILVVRAIWFHRRVLADEARLAAQFGPEYAEYKRRVRRWVPGTL